MRQPCIRLTTDTDEGGEMKFLLLIHGDADAEAAMGRDERMRIVGEHMEYAQMLRDLGVYVSGEALQDPASAVVVRPGVEPIVTDGPFAATKEALGGFYIVDVADRDEAIRLAAQIPVSPGIAVEVLAIADV
jgi:hypothetical protein